MVPGPDSSLSVTVGVLNWNCREFLVGCLSALHAQTYPHLQVVLVDNGSTDGSVDLVREKFPSVTIREAGRNLGYAGGNNKFLRELTGDLALIVNPDVVLAPDCVEQIASAMAADPSIGIIGCKLWYPGTELLQHAGGTITPPRAIPGHFGFRERDIGQHDSPRDVDYVIGAAMAIRRDTLVRAGLLDENIFLYFEDVDLCFRARRAGYRVVYLPLATGVHVESVTTQQGSFGYLHRFHTGRWYFLLKHYSLEQILPATLPAERVWLAGLEEIERLAAAIAYRSTLYNLPAIAIARTREGDRALSDEEWGTIEQAVAELYRQACSGSLAAAPLADQALQADLMVPAFTSNKPILGWAIARFRTAWNEIAGRWYIDHLRRQQVSFNRSALAYLASLDEELQARQALGEKQTIAHMATRHRASALEKRIETLRRSSQLSDDS